MKVHVHAAFHTSGGGRLRGASTGAGTCEIKAAATHQKDRSEKVDGFTSMILPVMTMVPVGMKSVFSSKLSMVVS